MPVSRAIHRLLHRFGFELSRRSEAFVIPRPEPGPLVSACVGLDWNGPEVDRVIAEALARYQHEFRAYPGPATADPHAYHSDNSFFGLADAAVCHALLRARRPSVVVEIGSGFSTRVLRGALTLNGAGRLVSVDPSPRTSIGGLVDEQLRVKAQSLPPSWYRQLPPDAVLFIDSSHVAGTGSDVTFLFLEVLPALSPGVLIHVHDVFLPEDYPRSWNLERGFNFSEQYLLQALLCDTRGFRVIWPGRWAVRNRADALARLVGSSLELERHCSFWFERVGVD
jgi:hypothetical protein